MFEVNELLKATGGRLIRGKKNIRVKSISIDSRTISRGEAFIAIRGNNFDGHDFIGGAIRKGASCVIHEPRTTDHGLRNIVFIEVKDTIKALGAIARFQRKRFNIPFIAVTGTNGKTTAKEMIAWVLSKKFKVLKNEGTKNNQIGLPLTLLNLDSSYDVAVLELGTNHFGEIGYLAKIAHPNIGIITNIGPAHLKHLKNLKGVFKEKYTLLKYLKSPHIAILNADDRLLRGRLIRKNKRSVILGFGIKHRSDFSATGIKIINERIEFTANQKYKFTLNTLGYYNIYNTLTAIAVVRILGIGYKDIKEALSTFDFPDSRLKFIELNNIKFIDDTYNSNPLSLKQALDVLDGLRAKGRKIFVMGDMLELGRHTKSFHRRVGYQVAKVCDSFITVGRLSNFAAEAARESGFDSMDIFNCQTTLEARDILFNKVSPNQDDIVLVKGSRLMRMEEIFKNR